MHSPPKKSTCHKLRIVPKKSKQTAKSTTLRRVWDEACMLMKVYSSHLTCWFFHLPLKTKLVLACRDITMCMEVTVNRLASSIKLTLAEVLNCVTQRKEYSNTSSALLATTSTTTCMLWNETYISYRIPAKKISYRKAHTVVYWIKD